jgi:hypothetical protein
VVTGKPHPTLGRPRLGLLSPIVAAEIGVERGPALDNVEHGRVDVDRVESDVLVAARRFSDPAREKA